MKGTRFKIDGKVGGEIHIFQEQARNVTKNVGLRPVERVAERLLSLVGLFRLSFLELPLGESAE